MSHKTEQTMGLDKMIFLNLSQRFCLMTEHSNATYEIQKNKWKEKL